MTFRVRVALPVVVLALLGGSLSACTPDPPAAPPPPLKLMPLGDSITFGSNVPGAYRTNLWHQLVQTDGRSVDFVGTLRAGPADLGDQDNEGHSGWRIDEVRAHVDDWLATSQPDVVLLHIGTNDIFQNYQLSSAPQRLVDLVNRICVDRPGVQIAVASLVPVPGAEAKVNAFNAQVPGVVDAGRATGCAVTFVDMFAAVPPTDIAGAHPTRPGYDKMAAAWYPVVSTMVDQARAAPGR